MPKNLVLLSDGTGNSSGKLFKTNVWRIYQAVDLTDPQTPGQPRQFAFYDDGVGTSSFKPLAVLGGAFGVGLSRNVRDLYVFLCRMYEPGDNIYAFGFSRGAFTIRVLLGLVLSQGLVRYGGNEADLQRWAADAYRAYRAARFKSWNPLVPLLRGVRDVALGVWNAVLRRRPYSQAQRIGQPGADNAIRIQFVGLWDTVDAYGLPVDELTRAIDRFVWPLTMRDYNLNPRVLRARHALALDDERNAFHPRLWNEEPQPGKPDSGVHGGNRTTGHIDDERISQVWFAGVHANVGGGYPDDSLSYVPLQWIMCEAHKHGLRFESQIWSEQVSLSDENGPLYDSRRGLAGYYRYNPRRIERLVHTRDVQVPRVKVHESVLRRIKAGHDGYAPIALPPDFAVMRIDGRIISADDYLQQMPHAVDSGGDPGKAEAPTPLTSRGAAYEQRRERVYNAVWWRRVAYFLTLAVTLVLRVAPLLWPGTGACADGGRLCVLVAPLGALGLLLPSLASVWLESFFSHPASSLPLLLALAACLWAGSWFAGRIGDHMRRVWYAMPPLRPRAAYQVAPPAVTGLLSRLLQTVRNHGLYQGAIRVLTHGVLPLAFLVAIAYGAFAVYVQYGFADDVAAGRICTAAPVPVSAAGAAFDLRSLCAPTATTAEAGGTYRIRLTVPGHARWWDKSIPAGPHGFEAPLDAKLAMLMAVAVPMRRHLTEPWFQLMARIGASGNDTYVLHAQPSTPPQSGRTITDAAAGSNAVNCAAQQAASVGKEEVFETTIVARSSGPLFVYVNDAIGPSWRRQVFYENNCGSARIDVMQLLPAGAASSATPN
ncbi:MAG: DUF2235 domain-containing protein [Rhizobacter sp.]|nr:DUF2235 domain-containing protein [Rhizobacter sp.]